MGSLSNLAKRLESRLDKLSEENNSRAIAAGEAILQDLVIVTPVDTSEALSNWQVGVNTPPSAPIGPYFPGKKGSTAAQSSDAAFAIGLKRLRSKIPGETIYISNLTDYITDLNRGTSAQEPAGFVERAVIVGRAILKRPLRAS